MRSSSWTSSESSRSENCPPAAPVHFTCGQGAGMTMVDAGVVAEELGAALNPAPWLSSSVAATRALTRMSADAYAAELLAGIADGSTIATIGPLSGPLPAAEGTGDGVTVRGEITALRRCDRAAGARRGDRRYRAFRDRPRV